MRARPAEAVFLRGGRRRWLVGAASWSFAMAVAGTAGSQPTEGTAELLRRGQAALAAARPDEALALFKQGYRDVAEGEARERFLLYQAVALQQQAEVQKRKEPLTEAVGLYREYLAHDPQSGVALNNLARAYEDLGQRQAAAECYGKAIALNDSRRLFYMDNYARALSKAGDWEAAAPVYRRLVKELPLAPGPHAALMEHYLTADRKGLLPYLWELLEAGQPQRACLGALEALLRPAGSPGVGGQGYELLTVVTLGLSRMTYEPASLGATEAGRMLQPLSSASDYRGACARQILDLHQRAGTLDNYACWRYRDQPKLQNVSPSEGFQSLIRGIGKRHRARGDTARASGDASAAQAAFDNAARYFHLALDLNKGMDVDPVAFDELVGLEVGRDNLKAVAELAEAYQRSLFESKAMAYAERQDQRIYQFHKALGEMYAVLGVWGNSTDARSAIFQLEHARQASGRLAQRDGAKLPQEYRFSPEMTDLLARSYGKSGRPAEGWNLRLEEAERYQKAGDRDAADEVLAPVRSAEPPPELKQRYQTLLKVKESLGPAGPEVALPRTETVDRARGVPDPHVHRTKEMEVRFAVGDAGGRVRLSASQREEIYVSLERFLERAMASDAQTPAWLDAPAGVRSVRIDEKGRGVLTLEVDGGSAEVPFEVRPDRGSPLAWQRK